MKGFEPVKFFTQTKRATKQRYIPLFLQCHCRDSLSCFPHRYFLHLYTISFSCHFCFLVLYIFLILFTHHHPDPAAPTNDNRSLEGFPIERLACERDPNSAYPVKQALPPASTHSRRYWSECLIITECVIYTGRERGVIRPATEIFVKIDYSPMPAWGIDGIRSRTGQRGWNCRSWKWQGLGERCLAWVTGNGWWRRIGSLQA